MADLHKDHRKRMDEKAAVSGLQFLPEHEVLEMILFAVIPRANTNEMAKRLIDEFGSIGNVLKAHPDDLSKIDGIGERAAKFLSSLYDILGIVERSLDFPKRRITSVNEGIDYVKGFFYGKLTEQFLMVTLNKTGYVIREHKISEGIDDEVHIYPKNIVIKALDDKASSVIIAHNHPGGTLSASFADEKLTQDIKIALKSVGIELYDSIIVSGGKGISIYKEDF